MNVETSGVSEVKNEKDTRVMIEATNVKSSDETSSCEKRVRSMRLGCQIPSRGTIEWLCAIKNKAG